MLFINNFFIGIYFFGVVVFFYRVLLGIDENEWIVNFRGRKSGEEEVRELILNCCL